MAQETQIEALHQPRGRWEGGSKGRGYMYTYGWFMLRFDRKQQKSVKQLFFNLKMNNFLKKKAGGDITWLLQTRQEEKLGDWFK